MKIHEIISTDSTTLRQKAEIVYNKKLLKTGIKLSEVDTVKLIHELEVHHIELEMQNEELAKAKIHAAELATQKYDELYDFAPSGFFTLSKEGQILELNLCGSKMLGKERNHLKNCLFGFFVSDRTKPIYNHFLEQIFINKKKVDCELILSVNGNPPVYAYLSGKIAQDGDQCLITALDVTERKLTENALKEKNEYYRLLFENSGEAIFFTHSDGTIYSANPEACRITSRSEDEIKKMGRLGVVDPNDTRLEAALEERRRTGHFKGELNFLRKDSTSFPAELSTMNFKDSLGNDRSGIIARDITRRKKNEEAILENNSRLNLVMQGANMAWWEMDIPTGNVVFGSKKAEMLGFLPEKFHHYSDFTLLLHPGDYHRVMKAMRDHFDGLIDKYEVEYRILTKEGGYKWFYDIGSVVKKDQKGKPLIVTGIVIDITERKKSEELIAESEKQRIAILQTAMDGYWLVDIRGRLLEVNETYCQMSGYTSEELMTMKISDLEVTESANLTSSHIQKTIETGEDRFETKHSRKDGSIFDVEISVQYHEADGGRFVAFMHDITMHKQAQELINTSEERLRNTLYDMQVGVILYSPKVEIILYNPKILEFLDISKDQLSGKSSIDPDWKVFNEDGSPLHSYNDTVHRAIATRQSVRDVVIGVYRPSKGDLVWLIVNAEPRLDLDGKVEKVVCTFINITKRKKSEGELHNLNLELENRVKKRTSELFNMNADLRIAEEKYRTVADFTYDWEYWINAKGGFNYVSPSCKRITGYTAEEFIKEPQLLKRLIYNADIEIWERHEKEGRIYSSGEINPDFNFRIVTKTGEIRWICSVSQKIYFKGIFLGIRASNRDITEKINAENELLNITIEVEERERNRFSRELHEGLGPLLSTVKVYFQWLAETTNVDKIKIITEKGNHYIETAIQTAHEVALGLSSLVLKNSGYVNTVINFVETIKETQNLDIDFNFNAYDRFGYLLETTLYRITTELLNNTIKYASAGHVDIDFNYQKEIHLITFCYIDNGLGFDLESIEKNSKGLGLLNIQQRIILLKGMIKIETCPGSGVKVYIELPVTERIDESESKKLSEL
jgi:PAS domain S-box-containing protein